MVVRLARRGPLLQSAAAQCHGPTGAAVSQTVGVQKFVDEAQPDVRRRGTVSAGENFQDHSRDQNIFQEMRVSNLRCVSRSSDLVWRQDQILNDSVCSPFGLELVMGHIAVPSDTSPCTTIF